MIHLPWIVIDFYIVSILISFLYIRYLLLLRIVLFLSVQSWMSPLCFPVVGQIKKIWIWRICILFWMFWNERLQSKRCGRGGGEGQDPALESPEHFFEPTEDWQTIIFHWRVWPNSLVQALAGVWRPLVSKSSTYIMSQIWKITAFILICYTK